MTIAAIEENVPALDEARTQMKCFHVMVRKRAAASQLDHRCGYRPNGSLAAGIDRDNERSIERVRANGQ